MVVDYGTQAKMKIVFYNIITTIERMKEKFYVCITYLPNDKKDHIIIYSSFSFAEGHETNRDFLFKIHVIWK